MKKPGTSAMFWRYEACDAYGVVTTGLIFAPSAASAAWHVKRFVAPTALVRVLDSVEVAA